MDHPQRQLGQLGEAVPAEARELDAGPHEYQRHRKHAEACHQPHCGLRAPSEPWPQVDFEMRALAHADHRADHDHPDEQEARHLFGPDVARDQRGVAREDLQRHRNDQDRHRRDQQPGQQPAVAGGEFAPEAHQKNSRKKKPLRRYCAGVVVPRAIAYLIALIFASNCSAPISLAYSAITGSTAFFIAARSANGMRFSLPAFSIASSLAVSSLDSIWRP